MKATWFEDKELITLYTNPAYFGADVPESYMQRPCKPVPVDSLFGYEPESKMDDIHHKNDVLALALQMRTGEYDGPPIVCRKHPKGLQVLDGHHRMQAARRAGIDKLDAVIVDSEDIQYSDAVREQVEEGWSDKYKKSINCSNPKGFSQKAHCAGRKKKAKESLHEGRDADLYHVTDDAGVIGILRSGSIKPKNIYTDREAGEEAEIGPRISLTRDFDFDLGDFKLIIDQSKLAQTHKITPYTPEEMRDEVENEAEEYVQKPIPLDYIKAIHVEFDDDATDELIDLAKRAGVPLVTGDRRNLVRINEASGYIPTAAQANDPRFKTALTVDVRPGEDQRNIEKLGLNLNMDLVNKTKPGRKRKKTLVESLMEKYQAIKEEDLVEVETSPTALRSWASSDEAKGVRAGFELELIFADTEREEDDDYGGEPNFDFDRPIDTNLDRIIDFYDGENYAWESIQPFDEETFKERIIDDLMDYINAKTYDYMNEYAYNDVKEKLEGDDSFEELDADAQEEYIDNEVQEQGRLWQEVFEEKEEEYRESTTWNEFFDEKNIQEMSDLMNEYGLVWPYQESSMGGSLPIESWGEQISEVIGKPVDISYTYHGSDKKEGHYTIEPDSSLSADEDPDSGYELVSPVMPLDEALDQLDKLFDYIEEQDGDIYTNSSTGLHMNISVPQGNKIDYTKLVLFSGDKYILDTYSRFENQYAESALGQLEVRAGQLEPERALQAMQKMKTNLEDAAEEFVRGSTGQSKYTSVHIKDGYIEFRGPGGQYTGKSFGEVKNTLLRFARAMTIAADPDAYKQEYQKKLYKIISKGQEKSGKRSIDSLFADLQSGEINSEVFKKRWANLVVQQSQDQAILNKLDGVPDDKRTQKARAIQQGSAGRPKPFKYNLPIEDSEGNRNGLKGKVTAASTQLAKQAAIDEILERLKDPNLSQFKPRFGELKIEIDLEDPQNFVRYAYAVPYADTRSDGEDKVYNNFIDVPKGLDMPTVRGRAIRHASENFFEPNADFTIAQMNQIEVKPTQLQPDFKNLATPAQPQYADEIAYTVTIPYTAGGKPDEHTVIVTAQTPQAAKQQAIRKAKRTVFNNTNFIPNYEQASVSSGDAASQQNADEQDTAGNYRITIPYENAQGQGREHTVNLAAEGPEEAKQQAIAMSRAFFSDLPELTPNYQGADVLSTDAAWMR